MGRISDKVDRAQAILKAVSEERNIDIRSIRSDALFHHFVAARLEVIRRSYAANIGCIIIARVLNKDHTTILYHARPGWRERKNGQRLANRNRAHG